MMNHPFNPLSRNSFDVIDKSPLEQSLRTSDSEDIPVNKQTSGTNQLFKSFTFKVSREMPEEESKQESEEIHDNAQLRNTSYFNMGSFCKDEDLK